MRLSGIAFNNLRRRKARMAFLVAGLLIGAATVVTLVSLTRAMTLEAQHKMENFGANILITPSAEQISLSYGGIDLGGVTVDRTPLRQDDLLSLTSIPNSRNIAAIAPKLLGVAETASGRALVMGVVPETEFRVKRWWTVDGAPLNGKGQIVAGNSVATRMGIEIGSTVSLSGEAFRVTGILQPTGSQDDDLLVISLADAQRLLNREGEVSLVEVAALCSDCPVEDMVRQISTALPGAKVNAVQQVVKTRMHALEQFRILSIGVGGVVTLIGALVVFVTMMGAVNERTREIGIFRALGFRRLHIVTIIEIEAIIVGLLAGVFGYLAGMGATYGVLPLLGGEHPHMAWDPVLAVMTVGLTLLVGGAASLYPAIKASRLDPSEALRTL